MTQSDSSHDEWERSEERSWFEAWLHGGMSLNSMEPKVTQVVRALTQERLASIRFYQDNPLQVTKY